MKKLLIIIISIFTINSVWADSPITYTDFYKAYTDVPMVQQALKSKGKISDVMMTYLAVDSNTLDVKLAVINAIGWSHKGITNSTGFLNYVVKTKKYKVEANGKSISFKWYATPDELICYAYLRAMDNYFDVIDANEIAELALKKTPNSFSVNMIVRLIKAQGLNLLNEDCFGYAQFNTLKTNTQLQMDMRKEAEKYIFEYMNSIGENCKKIN
jgi:hypothetical protein